MEFSQEEHSDKAQGGLDANHLFIFKPCHEWHYTYISQSICVYCMLSELQYFIVLTNP